MAALEAERHRTAPHRLPATRPLNLLERIRLATEIFAAYVYARYALHRDPITSVVARLRSRHSALPYQTTTAGGTLEEARRLGRAVARTLMLVPADTRCLLRSLVLTRLLAKRGIPTKLVIGTRAAPDFLAHAWVEYAGAPVLPVGDGSFSRLVEL